MIEKLRVGVLLDGETVPAWTARMLEEIEDSGDAEIVLLVFNGSALHQTRGPSGSVWRRLVLRGARFFPTAIRRLVEEIYRLLIDRNPELPCPFAEVPLPSGLAKLPRVDVIPERSRWSDRFTEDDLGTLRGHRLDVLLRCGFRILRGPVLEAARFGIWSLHHGDNRVNRGGPPCFWETMESWPATGSILQILSEDLDNGRILYRSWSCTNPLSLNDTRSALYWKSLFFIPRQLRALRIKGPEAFFAEVDQNHITRQKLSHISAC